MKRKCSTCLARGITREALYMAMDPEGLAWFECGDHDERDNIAGVRRVVRKPIAQAFAEAGLNYDDVEDLDEPAPATER